MARKIACQLLGAPNRQSATQHLQRARPARGLTLRVEGDYRSVMDSMSGSALLGLAIVVYATCAAVLAWIVHVIRTTPRHRLPQQAPRGGRG